jgi:hypothetical protein
MPQHGTTFANVDSWYDVCMTGQRSNQADDNHHRSKIVRRRYQDRQRRRHYRIAQVALEPRRWCWSRRVQEPGQVAGAGAGGVGAGAGAGSRAAGVALRRHR